MAFREQPLPLDHAVQQAVRSAEGPAGALQSGGAPV